MSLIIVIGIGLILTAIFHFIGVYAGAKKVVWIMLVLMWAGSINIAMSEVKPSGYTYIEKIKGQDAVVDAMIKEAMPKMSLYELLRIKQKVAQLHPKK